MRIRLKKSKWEGEISEADWEVLQRANMAKNYTILSHEDSNANVMTLELPEVAEFRGKQQKKDENLQKQKAARKQDPGSTDDKKQS